MPVLIADPISPKVYARVTGGSRQVWCPRCGHFNSRKIPPLEVVAKIRCTSCELVIYWGSTLYLCNDANAHDVPPDLIAPQFADVSPIKRRKGQPVNRLRQLNPDGTWEEL